jgi:hypothetical protein
MISLKQTPRQCKFESSAVGLAVAERASTEVAEGEECGEGKPHSTRWARPAGVIHIFPFLRNCFAAASEKVSSSYFDQLQQ